MICPRCKKAIEKIKDNVDRQCIWCERLMCVECVTELDQTANATDYAISPFCCDECCAKWKRLDELHSIYWKASQEHFGMSKQREKEAKIAKKQQKDEC